MLPTALLCEQFLRIPLPFIRKKNALTFTLLGFPPLVHQIVTELRFSYHKLSLRNQPTLGDAISDFPILMTSHYPDLDSVSDWSCHEGNLLQPIRSTTQIWVITCYQYGIFAVVSQTSFLGETSGDVTKCLLFS